MYLVTSISFKQILFLTLLHFQREIFGYFLDLTFLFLLTLSLEEISLLDGEGQLL
jgi:hypothetical protein